MREAASLRARREADEKAERARRLEAEQEASRQRLQQRSVTPAVRSTNDRDAAMMLVDFAQDPRFELNDEMTNLINTLVVSFSWYI